MFTRHRHDPPDRLCSGSISWGENFNIDPWGNLYGRTGITGKANTEGLSCLANTNNQLTTCSFGYDPAGNMTGNNPFFYTYDAENRMIWTSGYRYIYDGDGKRVEKCAAATATTPCPTSGTNGTLYWRGTGGDTQAESDLSGNLLEEYIYFNGQRIARRDASTGAVHYYFSDHLGSTSMVTDAVGTLSLCGSYSVATGENESDYYPFGGEMVLCSRAPQNYKFTGQERDPESGLDYFGARHYTSAIGRFMVPDQPFADQDPSDPQSWNLYAYVLNNPLKFVDPTGLDCVYLNDSGNGIEQDPQTGALSGVDSSSNQDECWANHGFWAPGTVSGNNWVQTDPNNDNVTITSSVQGFLLDTKAGYLPGGAAFSQDASFVDPIASGDLSPSGHAAALAIANLFNNSVPTVCAWTTTLSVSIFDFGVRVADTNKGIRVGWGPTGTISNNLRTTIGLSAGGDSVDPSTTIRIGTPAFGAALNPTNGQVGGYVAANLRSLERRRALA